jgi:hypothetical protein
VDEWRQTAGIWVVGQVEIFLLNCNGVILNGLQAVKDLA